MYGTLKSRFWSNVLSGTRPTPLVRRPLVITSLSGIELKGVARGWLRFADNLSRCALTSLNTYAPVASFLVYRRPFWVSRTPRVLASAEVGPLR
jgi:hypothetical protein